jgi:hypothetical protein
MLRPTVSRPVCLGIKHPSEAYDQIFVTSRHLRVCSCGALSLTRGQVCHFSPVGLVTIFYCLSFETSLFVASYDLQGYDGGIRLRLHTGLLLLVKVKVILRPTVSRLVRLRTKHPFGAYDQILIIV